MTSKPCCFVASPGIHSRHAYDLYGALKLDWRTDVKFQIEQQQVARLSEHRLITRGTVADMQPLNDLRSETLQAQKSSNTARKSTSRHSENASSTAASSEISQLIEPDLIDM